MERSRPASEPDREPGRPASCSALAAGGPVSSAARVLALQRAAGNRATGRLLARAPSNPADRARTIMYQLHGGLGLAPDVEAALAELRGQPPEVLREIRARYARLPGGYNLERDLSELGTAGERREALTLLGPLLPLDDHLRLSVHAGYLYDSVDQDVMVATLRDRMRAATPEERAAAAHDSETEALLRSSLDASRLYSALALLKGGVTEAMVEERIRAADSWWDDPQAVYDVLLDLPPERRRALWERTGDGDLFAFLSWGEREAVKRLCTSDDATAISVRMRLATAGPGTSETGVEKVAERLRQMREELAAVEARLATGASEDPEADSARRTDLWRTIGAVRWTEGDIVDMARGDLAADKANEFAAAVGEDPYTLLKDRLIDATRGDPDQVFAILEEASAHPGWLLALSWNNDVSRALTSGLSMKDQNLASALRHGDVLGAASLRLRRALNTVNTDEGQIVAILLELTPADRARLRAEDEELCDDLIAHKGWIDRELSGIVRLLLDPRTVEPPLEAVIDWALAGAWDGTKAQALESALRLMDDTRLAGYRLGYATARGGGPPAGYSAEEAALAAKVFTALDTRLQAELGYADHQRMLDVLLATPTPGELATERGVALAAAIVRLRALERAAPREAAFTEAPSDWTSTRLMDVVSSTGPLADEALIRLEQGYARATADATISGDELAILAALSHEYTSAHAAAVKATDWYTWAGSAAAAAGIAMAVTAASGGLLAPAAFGVFEMMGLAGAALAGATAAGAVKVGASELLAGSQYDATDEEGLRDFVGAFVDAGTTMLAGSLITAFPTLIKVKGVGLGTPPLSQRLAEETVAAAEASLRAAGRPIALTAARGGLESAFSGVVSEAAMQAVDERAWRQSVWDVTVTFGQAMLKSGGVGLVTGAGFGGLAEAGLVAKRSATARALVDDVVAAGVPAHHAEKLPLAAVRAIKQADAALDAGNRAGAEATIQAIKKIENVDHAVVDEVWTILSNRPRDPFMSPADERAIRTAPEHVAAISPAGDAALALPRPPSDAQLLRWLPSGWSESGLAALRPAQLDALQRLHARLAPLADDARVARGIARILPATPSRSAHSPAGWARLLDPVPDDRLEAVLRLLGDPALPDPTLVTGSAAIRRPLLHAGPDELAFAERYGAGVWAEFAGDRRWRDSLLPPLIRETSAMKDADARKRVEEALRSVREQAR